MYIPPRFGSAAKKKHFQTRYVIQSDFTVIVPTICTEIYSCKMISTLWHFIEKFKGHLPALFLNSKVLSRIIFVIIRHSLNIILSSGKYQVSLYYITHGIKSKLRNKVLWPQITNASRCGEQGHVTRAPAQPSMGRQQLFVFSLSAKLL